MHRLTNWLLTNWLLDDRNFLIACMVAYPLGMAIAQVIFWIWPGLV